jgi:hypothetical protein
MAEPTFPEVQVSTTSATSPQGPVLTTVYVGREVRVLAVLEPEVHSISMFNTLTTAFLSAGSSSVTMAIGIWVSGAFSEKLTPTGEVLSHFGAPILCALGLLMYYLAHWAHRARASSLDSIRTESKSKSPAS